MRKFSINCDFGGQLAPFDIFIGQPEQSHHPLHFQADWLLKQRGGTILPEVMDAIAKLNTLALENGVPLEDLCVYALGSAQEETTSEGTATSTEEAVSDDPQVEGNAAEEGVIEPIEPQPSQEASSSPTNDSTLDVTHEADVGENNQGDIGAEELQIPIDETPDTEVIPGGTEEKDEALSPQSEANVESPTDENKQ